MVTLYTFGPAFGLPDPSPFGVKGHLLLKMAGLAYETAPADFKMAPKGKFPIIRDDGQIVPDTTLIRFHIEKKYGFDFDHGLSPAERGAAWAFEKMCEDHLYWVIVQQRWMIPANFNKGPRNFFKAAPAFIRPLIVSMVRRKVKRNLFGQGSGRYDETERRAITARAFGAIAAYLENRAFIGGDAPCGADASVFATVLSAETPFFDSYLTEEVRKHPALVAYIQRMKARYFPEMA
jgi:glutathione S-transferase